MKRIMIIGILSIIVLNCATTPIVHVWRPWQRVLEIKDKIDIGSEMSLEISGSTTPLLGNENLLKNSIYDALKDYLERRGFGIVDSNSKYHLVCSYKTDRIDKFSYSSSSTNYHFSELTNYSFTGSLSRQGLGVGVAGIIGRMDALSAQINRQKIEQKQEYCHTISLEIYNDVNHSIWKGESTWDASTANIFSNLKFVMQLLLSNLPKDNSIFPTVPTIINDKAANYFKLNCQDYWFSCPALPYKITFSDYFVDGYEVLKLPKSILNPEALAAYVDLINTAEYALPKGEKNINNPLKRSLWKKVVLGGKYKLSPGNEIKNVLIQLKGEKKGYTIERAWLATDEQYLDYLNDLNKWKENLKEFYDYYE